MEIDSGATAWVLASSALVLLMTPGLGFFYGGLVRGKNVLTTMFHSFFMMLLISVVWVLWGYTIAFGDDKGGLFGGLNYLGFDGVTGDPLDGSTIPHAAFAVFQMMFAIITPALISGAFAERKKFSAFVLFSLAWSTFIYSPLAHWVWGGGWLFERGALDFAGGTVVHLSSGVSALVCAIVLGKRTGFGKDEMEPHNVPYTILGAALLWFGWFGFNAGSALGANGQAAMAFLVTNIAGAAGGLGWLGYSWIVKGKPSVVGGVAGAVAGLVAITPAAGFVDPLAAIAIGLIGGILSGFAVDLLKKNFGVDDALDVFAVHGIGGIWGSIATGIFAKSEFIPDGRSRGGQIFEQILAVGAAGAFAAAGTFVILMVLKAALGGLRVPETEETTGLDFGQHGELAYRD
ncbi:MAG: ammonium transporter [Thermomicrobiales bacterium]